MRETPSASLAGTGNIISGKQLLVNGNTMSDSVFTICHEAVRLEKADGNKLSAQIQPDANCTRALYCDYGYFNSADLMVWDWATPPAVEYTGNTAYNKLVTNLKAGQILDNGWKNDKRVTNE